jgi:hypothetical protein
VSNKKHGLGYALGTWLPVVLGVTVIVAESTELFGADHTSAPLRRIYEVLFGRVSNGQWERASIT